MCSLKDECREREPVRMVHYNTDTLKVKTEQMLQELTSHLPREALEQLSKFVENAQKSQHTKGNKRQTRNFQTLLSRLSSSHRIEELTQRKKDDNTTRVDIHEKWVKNLSDRGLTHPERTS